MRSLNDLATTPAVRSIPWDDLAAQADGRYVYGTGRQQLLQTGMKKSFWLIEQLAIYAVDLLTSVRHHTYGANS